MAGAQQYADQSANDLSALSVEWSDGWRTEERATGGVFVYHQHSEASRLAYQWTDTAGTVRARCPICHAERTIASAMPGDGEVLATT
jgi:hypothetical protein